MLNDAQREAARALLAARPTVLPGTKVIQDDSARSTWYRKVNLVMAEHKVAAKDVPEFCDIAGVPD